jgi:hypothetical protein
MKPAGKTRDNMRGTIGHRARTSPAASRDRYARRVGPMRPCGEWPVRSHRWLVRPACFPGRPKLRSVRAVPCVSGDAGTMAAIDHFHRKLWRPMRRARFENAADNPAIGEDVVVVVLPSAGRAGGRRRPRRSGGSRPVQSMPLRVRSRMPAGSRRTSPFGSTCGTPSARASGDLSSRGRALAGRDHHAAPEGRAGDQGQPTDQVRGRGRQGPRARAVKRKVEDERAFAPTSVEIAPPA